MRPPYETICALLTLALLSCRAAAGADTEDVVYLHAGAIIRGQITRVKPGESVTLQTPDGGVVSWAMDEIREVEREAALARDAVAPPTATPVAVDPSSVALSDLGADDVGVHPPVPEAQRAQDGPSLNIGLDRSGQLRVRGRSIRRYTQGRARA